MSYFSVMSSVLPPTPPHPATSTTNYYNMHDVSDGACNQSDWLLPMVSHVIYNVERARDATRPPMMPTWLRKLHSAGQLINKRWEFHLRLYTYTNTVAPHFPFLTVRVTSSQSHLFSPTPERFGIDYLNYLPGYHHLKSISDRTHQGRISSR